MKRKNAKKLIAAAVSVAMCATAFVGMAYSASAAQELNPTITYTGGDYTFEKISHPKSPQETTDGIVDYVGNGSISEYIDGLSEGNGDRGQSYSYASAVHGDWVYINTMYGGLGAASILKGGMRDLDPEIAQAMMDAMYNGNMYTGEPDGQYAGGILLKFNVKTGESKILMSRDVNHLIPTFRSACEMNGKLYFVGMVVDTDLMTPQEVSTAIAVQNGLPCIYEVDPENNDKLTLVYNCVDMDGYRKLVQDNVFTSTRAIGIYNDTLITGCLDTNGVFLCASKDPSAGQDSFKVIANMEDLFNYPAFHRSDVNGGGGIYQVIEYNNKLYVVICTGTAESKNPETGTLKTYAIVRGECNGDPTDADAWTWSVLAGDKADGAKYPFGLDEERVSAGACTLEVYNDYLYIGEYNDTSSALQGLVLRNDFKTLETNLQQSVNLYRMDKDENVEMIVGDPTTQFPNGGISQWGSGYETHMSQYTWQMTVYEDKLYVSTMDATTLLRPVAQLTNGDILKLSPEEWQKQINYIRVLLELILKSDNTQDQPSTASINSVSLNKSAENEVEQATQDAEERSEETTQNTSKHFAKFDAKSVKPVSLTEEQKDKLVKEIVDGSVSEDNLTENQVQSLTYLNNMLSSMTELLNTNHFEAFAEKYKAVMEYFQNQSAKLPEGIKQMYNMLLKVATKDNIVSLAKSMSYMKDSTAGFDLYEIQQNSDGSVNINTITNDGFGDRYNHGLRIFAKTPDYLLIGTANPFYGTQLWRRANTVKEESSTPESSDVPESSVAPESSDVPESSVAPESSDIPESSVTPESSDIPESSVTPESSDVPESSVTPESSDVSESSFAPESSDIPESSATTESSDVSDNTGLLGLNSDNSDNSSTGGTTSNVTTETYNTVNTINTVSTVSTVNEIIETSTITTNTGENSNYIVTVAALATASAAIALYMAIKSKKKKEN